MYLYRVMKRDRYLEGNITNEENKGLNSFVYDEGEEYVHFFILPEFAESYQQKKYNIETNESVVLKCDVPYSIIKDNFGIGMYDWYSHFPDPIAEVRLNKNEFNSNMVVDVYDSVPKNIKNKKIFDRYIKTAIEDLYSPLYIDPNEDLFVQLEKKPIVNPEFNFLNYFSNEELEKENLTNDYRPLIYYKDTKIETLSKNLFNKGHCKLSYI